MKKDIEEIKIILAEIQQRIMYIEECEERQSQTLKGMERTEKEDPVTIPWQRSDNKQQSV